MRLIDADALSETLKQMIQQADMKILENTMALVTSFNYRILKKQIEEILNGLSKFPTVEQQEWIPVSERLPKYGQVVLWCNEHGSVFTSAITVRCGDSWAIGKKHRSAKVVAWMPLPEPWKEENNEVE